MSFDYTAFCLFHRVLDMMCVVRACRVRAPLMVPVRGGGGSGMTVVPDVGFCAVDEACAPL